MSERKGWIYGLFDSREPGRLRYVGKTVGRRGVKDRVYHHVWGATSRYTGAPSQNWIRKIGSENLEYVILEEVTFSEANAAEVRWIRELRSQGMADLNLLDGGDGMDSAAVTGEGNPKSKMTWREVRDIRNRATREYVSAAQESDKYGLTPAALSKVLRNFTWYDPEYDPSKRVTLSDFNTSGTETPVWRRFPDRQVEEIRQLYLDGVTPSSLAKQFGTGLTSIRRILFEKYGSDETREQCCSRRDVMKKPTVIN